MNKLKIGFIGAGGVAKVHLKNTTANKHAEVAAICDIGPEVVKEQAEKYGVNGYTDAVTMLDSEQLDAVFISVPPFARGRLEEEVAERGIHLLAEKPLGLDLEQARRKQKVIEDSGVIHASGYCLRYWDIVQKAKTFLANRDIAMVRGYYLSKFVETPWYRVRAKSGGQLVEQSTHILDLIRYFAGDVTRVSAEMSLVVSNDIEGLDIPDVSTVNMRFSTGAVANLTSTFTQTDHRMGVEILGRDFRITLDGRKLTLMEDGVETIFTSEQDFHQAQDNAFIDAVRLRDRRLVLASYPDGVETLALSLAAGASNDAGKTILIDEE
ncbi:Gfo/Idh/MocA family protein [Virgibacillus natechei]